MTIRHTAGGSYAIFSRLLKMSLMPMALDILTVRDRTQIAPGLR